MEIKEKYFVFTGDENGFVFDFGTKQYESEYQPWQEVADSMDINDDDPEEGFYFAVNEDVEVIEGFGQEENVEIGNISEIRNVLVKYYKEFLDL